MLRILIIILATFVYNANVQADVVYLKNGTAWKNVKLLKSEETGVTITLFTSMKKRIILAKSEIEGYQIEKFVSTKESKLLLPGEFELTENIIKFSNNNEEASGETVKVSDAPNSEIDSNNKNILALGYQIGGYCLVGVDYEIRTGDYLGIHVGGGFAGFTTGIKVHTNPQKDSNFINFSFKDGGFGLIQAVAAEYGGRWVFNSNSSFGLHYQIGLMYVTHVSDKFIEALYDDENKKMPKFNLSMGIGFSW
jgi:hypothetical protein